MKAFYVSDGKIKLHLISMGILIFSLCLWLYSIFPLFVPYPVACFIALAALSVTCLLCRYCRKKGIYVYRSSLLWVCIILSFMISNTASFDIYTCVNMLIYVFGVLFVVFCRRTLDAYDSSIKTLKILAGLYIASIYFQYLAPNLFEQLFLERFDSSSLLYYQSPYLIGMGGSPGVATVNCTIAFAILISFNKDCKMKTYMVKLPYMLVILTAYFLIGKKSGLLSAVFGVIMVYLVRKEGKIWKKIITLLSCLFVLGCIVYCVIQLNEDLFISLKIKEGIKQFIEGEDFSSGRITLYKAACKEFLRYPILGMGWQGFSAKYGNLVHNIYLQLLCETGVIGFLLFMMPIVAIYFRTCNMIRNCKKERFPLKTRNYLVFSFYIQSEFLFISLFENNLYMVMPLYLYFFASGIAVTARNQSTQQNKDAVINARCGII